LRLNGWVPKISNRKSTILGYSPEQYHPAYTHSVFFVINGLDNPRIVSLPEILAEEQTGNALSALHNASVPMTFWDRNTTNVGKDNKPYNEFDGEINRWVQECWKIEYRSSKAGFIWTRRTII